MALKKPKGIIMEILSIQCRSLVNEDEVMSKFVSFTRPDLDCSPIDQQQATSLEVAFIVEEVGKVIQFLDFVKTPESDDFTRDFKKKCWNNLRADIMRVFQYFFQNGIINDNLNETYIYLISKKMDACIVVDFHPISLMSGLCKIIARVLSS